MTLGRRHVYLLLALGLLLTGPISIQAQDKDKVEKARFTTVDSVELHGSFFPSAKKNAPVVIMLHAVGVGQDSKKKEWVSLAEALQKSGLAVLTFDFRGHGLSTEITVPQIFWSKPMNVALVKPSDKEKTTIEVKNFAKNYYPALVNDIAAARAYLERTKNDDGSCNTGSIIVIGAETGATLGAGWMYSEWFRHKLNQPAMFGMQKELDPRNEGKDIIAGIWLSITPTLGSRTVKLTSMLDVPVRMGATPMLFMYADGDVKGKDVAKACEKALKVAKSDKHRYIAAVELKGSKLTGAGLLQKSLGTEKAIVEYLEEVVDNKSNEWSQREFKKNEYVWRIPVNGNPVGVIIPAKPAGENNLFFETYEKFFP